VVEEGFEDEPETYYIVGAHEADPGNGRISNQSPIGQALLGASIGDSVTAQVPAGEIRLKITGIS
jgi:transcription elongation factor GreA